MKLVDIENILFYEEKVKMQKVDYENIDRCFLFLAEFSKDKVIYGINTGFGPMAQYRVGNDDLNKLQYNIIRSHSCGAGEPLSNEVVKAAMLSRMQTFLAGKSGVSVEVVVTIKYFINNNITPFIPQHGGVGASGDLVQLAHLGLS